MSVPIFQPTYEKVNNEGALLNVWHQGSGRLLILIQGGGGTGKGFNEAFPHLSRHYKVATYDRRGNGESIVETPRLLNPMESARDVKAIIKALGYTKASVFGTSSGGLIALQLAQSYPECLESVVIHEIPITSILSDESIPRVDSGYAIYQTYLENGAEAAFQQFRSSITGKPPEAVPAAAAPSQNAAPHRLEYFFRYEFIVFMIYTPNLDFVRASGIPIATVEGIESNDVFHARSAQVQSEILKCTHVVWTGAHAPFVTHPDVFARELHMTVEKLGNM